jgi:hypothetical protein
MAEMTSQVRIFHVPYLTADFMCAALLLTREKTLSRQAVFNHLPSAGDSPARSLLTDYQHDGFIPPHGLAQHLILAMFASKQCLRLREVRKI